MRLTRFTDVALRVLMRLAVVENEDPPTTREVAATMQVPYTHAAKVVAKLQHLGLVEARRGRGGGLSSPERAGPPRSADSSASWRGRVTSSIARAPPLPLRSACRLRGALHRAEEAFYASLDPITVTELVASPTGPLLIGISRGRPGAD